MCRGIVTTLVISIWIQSQFPDVDEKQLKEMDQRMVQLQDKLKQSQTHCRERESRKT